MRRAALCLAVWLLLPGVGRAGLAPLKTQGQRVCLDGGSALVLERDAVHYRLLPDRVEVVQQLVLRAPRSSRPVLLGLPLPAERWRGPQDVIVERLGGARPEKLETRRVASFGWRPVGFWQVCALEPGSGRIALRVRWWQPHEAGALHGYRRMLLADPLWTASGYAGSGGQIARRVGFSGGAEYSSSRPLAEELDGALGGSSWRSRGRRWRRSRGRAGPRETLALYYRLTRGAHSRCSDVDPWLALDGDPDTRWAPADCPGEAVALELTALCRGFGTAAPACDRVLEPTFDLALAARTPAGEAGKPLRVEGWWGRRRLWRVRGRQNQTIRLRRRERVTRYRVVFPKGLPAAGAGEIQLARLDLERSDPQAVAVLTGRGHRRTTRRCRVEMAWRNPVALRRAVLHLKPGQEMDAFMLSADCADGRRRKPYHEPVPCDHSPEEIAAARRALDAPDLGPFHHEHYRRAHPWTIELELDPSCLTSELRLKAPPVCSDDWRPFAPRLELEL